MFKQFLIGLKQNLQEEDNLSTRHKCSSPKCPLFGGFTVFMSYMYLLDCDDGVLAGFDSADDSTFDSLPLMLCEMEDRKSHKAQ